MNKLNLNCIICGKEGAQGFNYSGCKISCYSCKVFFHRHAEKHQKVKCKKDGKCLINNSKGRQCMKCRLDKCVSIGMVKENKLKIELDKEITTPNMIEISPLKNILITIDSELQIEEETELTQNLLYKQRNKKKPLNELNWYEVNRIDEVQKAVNVLVEETAITNIRIATDFFDAIGSPEYLAKQVIKFCKQLNTFNQLSEQDQFALFKPFCFKMLSLRCAFSFDLEKDGFVASEDESGNSGIFIRYELCESSKDYDLVSFNKRVTVALCKEMDNDRKIRDLLSAQQLFMSQFNTVSCPEFVRYNFAFYSRLLCRYLEHKYQCPRLAKNKFELLMNLLNNIELVKQYEGVVFRDIAKEKLPHAYVEMYDLV